MNAEAVAALAAYLLLIVVLVKAGVYKYNKKVENGKNPTGGAAVVRAAGNFVLLALAFALLYSPWLKSLALYKVLIVLALGAVTIAWGLWTSFRKFRKWRPTLVCRTALVYINAGMLQVVTSAKLGYHLCSYVCGTGLGTFVTILNKLAIGVWLALLAFTAVVFIWLTLRDGVRGVRGWWQRRRTKKAQKQASATQPAAGANTKATPGAGGQQPPQSSGSTSAPGAQQSAGTAAGAGTTRPRLQPPHRPRTQAHGHVPRRLRRQNQDKPTI